MFKPPHQRALSRGLFSRRALSLSAPAAGPRQMFRLGELRARERPEIDLIDLSLGNPDLDPPEAVGEALRLLTSRVVPGVHRYMDSAGFADVRERLAAHLREREALPVTAQSLHLTCGAAGGLQILLLALLDAGDEVVVLAPYFPEFLSFIANAGARAVIVPPGPGFLPRLEDIAAALSPRTRALLLNTPNNPSGAVYPQALIDGIAGLLREHRGAGVVQLISDETYARLRFDGRPPSPILRSYDATWVVRSFSKDVGLAGERIGYLAWGPELARVDPGPVLAAAARSLGYASAPALAQRLIPAALGAAAPVETYARRAQAFTSVLRGGGVEIRPPQGTFYAFPRAPMEDEAFCQRLADRGVLCVPGRAFGAPGYFRASLTQPLERIVIAAERIVSCAAELRRSA